MILIIDVHYRDQGAKAVAGLITDWNNNTLYKSYSLMIGDVADYIPGQFYQRELPCILQLLQGIDEAFDTVVIDGYVHLGTEQKPGLGHYLWDALGQQKKIIGVAKNHYQDTPAECMIYRGESHNPLYITALGLDLTEAKNYILNMVGAHRIPTLIKQVDTLSKAVD